MLDQTANVGATQIVLMHKVSDWKVGDRIVIASTDWEHMHSEERTITSISHSAT